MPRFSNQSMKILTTCHPEIQRLFLEVVKTFDCKPTFGHRSPEEQLELFKKGRELKNGIWTVIDKSKVVTNCDGFEKKSEHNHKPSLAIDICPYPIDWKDINRFYMFGGYVLATANFLNIKITWGGDWNNNTQVNDQSLMDLPHFQLRI